MYSSLLLNLLCFVGATNSFNPGAGNSFGIPNQNATYDYVVVGGGASGLTVANRLTEDSSKFHCRTGI